MIVMPTSQALVEIADQISASGLPALYIDTCAALDVVRCGARGQPRIAGIVRQLIDAHASGELLLFTSSVVPKEAARNRAEVEASARKNACEIDERLGHYQRIAGTFGTTYPHTACFQHESLVSALVGLCDQLLEKCTCAITDDHVGKAALARAGDNRRPARKGGGVNDCILLEEFLSIARVAAKAEPLILLTTNIADFGDSHNRAGIHPDLAAELVDTRARLCLNWEEALHALSPARRKLI